MGLPRLWLESRAHIIGVRVRETTADATTEMLSVIANSRKRRPTIPVMKRRGMKHGDERDTKRNHSEADLLCAFQRGSHGRLTHLNEADDILDHHDGIIDDKAGGDGERHERQIIETEADEFHHAKRSYDRKRQRDTGDDGRPKLAQKDEYDHDDKHTVSTSVNCTSDTEARIVSVRSVSTATFTEGGRREAEFRQQRFHTIRRLDNICSGLSLDIQYDSRLGTDPPGKPRILDIVHDISHVPEP